MADGKRTREVIQAEIGENLREGFAADDRREVLGSEAKSLSENMKHGRIDKDEWMSRRRAIVQELNQLNEKEAVRDLALQDLYKELADLDG
ncbi:hypothetical protein [Sorangium sp. So ce1000]|uniref:hypothetical protein n=1 Tax=Sorangium sp. So ce1000 TaxID=3133325 RepID=UPI003F6074E5